MYSFVFLNIYTNLQRFSLPQAEFVKNIYKKRLLILQKNINVWQL
jgi:hypothetical protein